MLNTEIRIKKGFLWRVFDFFLRYLCETLKCLENIELTFNFNLVSASREETMMTSQINLGMTVIGFALTTLFIVFVCTRLWFCQILNLELFKLTDLFGNLSRNLILHQIQGWAIWDLNEIKASSSVIMLKEATNCKSNTSGNKYQHNKQKHSKVGEIHHECEEGCAKKAETK